MRKTLLALLSLYTASSFSGDKFFANEEIQHQAPLAFALQEASHNFLLSSHKITLEHANKLITAINSDPQLVSAISRWKTLTFEQQTPYLKKVFKLEYASFGIEPPELIIDNTSYPGKTVFFDFDINNPSSGIVYLNPNKLSKMDKYAALAFLIHETRHSYQFQLSNSRLKSVLVIGYKNAFEVQKSSTAGTLSFSDFLTLLNEYEAFMFGNYVIGKLTNWKVDQSKLGTYASQFDKNGALKIDLLKLHKSTSNDSVLLQFNKLMKSQKEYLGR